MRDDSDEALMLSYRGGDVRAFEVLLERHRKPVYSFILRYVLIPAQAEDLLQDTFMRVIKGAGTYERQAKFTTWLYTIARNICVDASRRGKHRKAASLDAPMHGDSDGEAGPAMIERMPSPVHAVDRQVIGHEARARIQAALDALADEQREVFVLRELCDMPFKEIAEVVGCPENTVKSRMRYALEKLREALGEYRDLAEAAQG